MNQTSSLNKSTLKFVLSRLAPGWKMATFISVIFFISKIRNHYFASRVPLLIAQN